MKTATLATVDCDQSGVMGDSQNSQKGCKPRALVRREKQLHEDNRPLSTIDQRDTDSQTVPVAVQVQCKIHVLFIPPTILTQNKVSYVVKKHLIL